MNTTTILSVTASLVLLSTAMLPAGQPNKGRQNAPVAAKFERGGQFREAAERRGPNFGEEGPGMKHDPFWQNEEAVAYIGLTPTQVAALESTATATKEALEALKETSRDVRSLIREELESDNPNLNTINALVDEGAKQRSDRAKIGLGHRVAVQTTLSADQEVKLQEWREGRREEMRGRAMEVREALRDAETTEEAAAILEEMDVPEPMRERILERFEQRGEKRGEGFAPEARGRAGRPNRPMPPLPPDAEMVEDEF